MATVNQFRHFIFLNHAYFSNNVKTGMIKMLNAFANENPCVHDARTIVSCFWQNYPVSIGDIEKILRGCTVLPEGFKINIAVYHGAVH